MVGGYNHVGWNGVKWLVLGIGMKIPRSLTVVASRALKFEPAFTRASLSISVTIILFLKRREINDK